MPDIIKSSLLLALCAFISVPAIAQKIVRGTITDASNGETLPSANISIQDTYRGTISNRDGCYTLTIPDSLLPATMVVRYLGFNTETRIIRASSEAVQNFSLEPSTLELGEVVVMGEDPAISIMREVIRRKQQWRDSLNTYKAEAYTRMTISNDTSIVMISESVSEAFWDAEQGHREVLKSKRQTANIEASENFAGVSYFPNFYDDNIEIAGFELMGVTHPNALDFYDFTLEGYQNIDDQVVYEINVNPARKLQPLFRGTIYVLDKQYALLEVKLQPNDVVKFPQPVKSFNTYYEQQFNNYGRQFWLPADMRIQGDIKISMVGLEFPTIKFRQISQITNYEVNVPLPDSLYEQDDVMTVDSTAIKTDSLFVKAVKSVPLTNEEEQAYSTLDSTATLEKAFKPSGFLARFMDEDSGEGSSDGFLSRIPGDISPALRYNRVDELYAGLGYSIGLTDRLDWKINGGYSTGYGEWGYGGGLAYELIQTDNFNQTLGIAYSAHTATQQQSTVYGSNISSISNLLGEPDYYNYYRKEGFRLFSEFELDEIDWSATVGFNSEKHTALTQQTRYDIFGRDQPPQLNPAVNEGTLRSLDLEIGYNLDEEFSLGVTSMRQVEVKIEHSDGALGSDFDFTRYSASIDWNFPTFYQRRLLSNTLDLKLTAGTFSGTLPLQKLGTVDVAIDHFSPFGTLKTRQMTPYVGEQYVSLNVEHNFRSVPFEALGLRQLVDWDWGLILFGGAGKTWISDTRKQSILDRTSYLVPETDGVHLEAGISLNGLFGLFRVDFAQRLDQPAFMVNISIARIF